MAFDIEFEGEAAGNMFSAFGRGLRNCFKFKGRTCRYDYWGFCFVNSLIMIALGTLSGIVPELSFLALAYTVLMIIPCIFIYIRRLHDVNKSFFKWVVLPIILGGIFVLGLKFGLLDNYGGVFWAILLSVLMIGWTIALLVFICRKGNPDDNQYGNPFDEDVSHDRRAKWMIFFVIVVPFVLQVGAEIMGGVAGYNEAMQRHKERLQQIQSQADDIQASEANEVNQTQEINVEVSESAGDAEANEVNQPQEISVEVNENAGEAEANEVDQTQEINVEVNESADEAVNEEAE